jgi:hypothetical protein
MRRSGGARGTGSGNALNRPPNAAAAWRAIMQPEIRIVVSNGGHIRQESVRLYG